MNIDFKEVGELMIQKEEINKKIKELNIVFSMLNEEAQESAWIYVKFSDTFCLSFSLGQHPEWIVPHPK